jgi:hypothetical protein
LSAGEPGGSTLLNVTPPSPVSKSLTPMKARGFSGTEIEATLRLIGVMMAVNAAAARKKTSSPMNIQLIPLIRLRFLPKARVADDTKGAA